jgi:hypothetical protein
MKKKSLLSEVRQLQKIAGLLKEDTSSMGTSVEDAFAKAGIVLEAPCVTVDDEIKVERFKTAREALAQLEERVAGQTAASPAFLFPGDVNPGELMGTPDDEVQATEGLKFKLMVDILDGGFVEIWQ